MRSFLGLVLACVSLSLLHAQDAPVPPVGPQNKIAETKPAPPVPNGRIIGTVFCSDTHRPARGAVVMLSAKPGTSNPSGTNAPSRAGINGSYVFDHVAPGEYMVIAVLPGYLTPFDGMTVNPSGGGEQMEAEVWKRVSEQGTVTVHGSDAARLDVELHRGAAVSGRVLYSDGSPATQVSIAVEDVKTQSKKPSDGQPSFDVSGIMRMMFTHQSLATDDRGQFRISGLPPGTYRVAAVHPSTAMSGGGDDMGLGMFFGASADPMAIRVFSGDTLHRKEAKTYDLHVGEEISGIDITIPIDAFHSVAGHLSAVDGRTLNMGDLTLTDPSDESFSMRTELQRDGSFSFPSVAAGTYMVSSKNARIGDAQPDAPADYASNFPLIPKVAFADASQTIVVKDADVSDVNFALTEVPLPPDPSKPNPNPPAQGDQTVQPQ
jgi:hypothetical protein